MTFVPVERLFAEPQTSYFLFGPRGTGKSTLAFLRHPHAFVIDLRLNYEFLRLTANPDILVSLVRALSDGSLIVIDEIQRVPSLLPLVHLLIEEKRGGSLF